MKHQPRKRFGQNFLQDEHVIDKILQSMHLQKEDKVVEIGPGLGALTKPLLQSLTNLFAIEIDRDLQENLRSLPLAKDKLHLFSADALTIDYSQWGPQLRVIGNLPYNISTPLLFHLLHYSLSICDMHFMLQKEVVFRIAAQPGTKAYGKLTVMVQYLCEAELLFVVPPEAFYPKPKVDSAVIRLTPYQISPYPQVDIKALEQVVAKAFAMRRKTLANNLKSMIDSAQLRALGIDPLARPEQISVRDYVNITKHLS